MLDLLKKRFEERPELHVGLAWDQVERRLADCPRALEVAARMEETGGEPAVVALPGEEAMLICDCAKESPKGRRSLCYDDEALQRRKKNPPVGSAMAQAEAMGVTMMDESLYRALQGLVEFDLKTSSWVLTPDDIRGLGGAIFCERRYGRVFTFHNGADSYYGVRGWRGVLRV
ncbi:MAG: DUF4256 domain-containing protein [Coriobacteriales bacterium]|jgi:hypothetical protein|nr:DUF4256 domain-containing protein [Coriobacteriales bacterium]